MTKKIILFFLAMIGFLQLCSTADAIPIYQPESNQAVANLIIDVPEQYEPGISVLHDNRGQKSLIYGSSDSSVQDETAVKITANKSLHLNVTYYVTRSKYCDFDLSFTPKINGKYRLTVAVNSGERSQQPCYLAISEVKQNKLIPVQIKKSNS